MAYYNEIDKFEDFIRDNWAFQLTVIEYRSRGGVWSRKSGKLMRLPEFGGGFMKTVRFRLHKDADDTNTRTTDVILVCESDDRISFELSEDGTKGTLRGFTRQEYDVDIVAHARTR